jgi:PqqD family protein of HPr-rel-A system
MTAATRRRPARRADVEIYTRHSGAALYDPVSQMVHVVNHTALAIWQLCDGQTDPDEMVDAVCQLSGLPRDVAAEDIENTLTELDVVGLIVWNEER